MVSICFGINFKNVETMNELRITNVVSTTIILAMTDYSI